MKPIKPILIITFLPVYYFHVPVILHQQVKQTYPV